MSATVNNAVLDAALIAISRAGTILFCTDAPSTLAFAQAMSLGDAPVAFTLPIDAPAGGRMIVASVQEGSNYKAGGVLTHYALVQGDTLLASGPLAGSKAVNLGDPIVSSTFDVTLPGPVA
ncbi:hypothetical protein [Falsirhodobacter sp. 20TX0035]|uniref:hypothetical protein n=1 Tax=Falsirhodobacter sp. 20TX0035 TaxID=3022019 RepID=UPI00232B61E0|nr:hypothetical protein [Falsirhodobacter sp. 20TX0035]MDB6454840.1 hypothetical protein [Falsirhodobacter sp. 20TX0035]